MQQQFSTRNYSVRDFEEWQERSELVLAPKFQRRDVWNPKAKSYLIDTIIRGKPIPKLYMRQNVAPSSRRTTREIVDGQQRLRTVLSFVSDGFKLSRTHNKELGGSFFSQLDTGTQKDILKYEFVVDLLQDMPDNEIYDLFARINSYGEKLRPQELRNARYFGEFKTAVYDLAKNFSGFLESNEIFSAKAILRMAEAEFISELLLAMEEGIKEGKKGIIDAAYVEYDDDFPNRARHEKRFGEVVDTISAIVGDELPTLKFRGPKLFYPLFCSVYHMKFGLPKLTATPRKPVKSSDYPKVKEVLEDLHAMIGAAEKGNAVVSGDDRKFFEAQDEHWVHASNRVVLTHQLCKRFCAATK